jgi:hypothetical protein
MAGVKTDSARNVAVTGASQEQANGGDLAGTGLPGGNRPAVEPVSREEALEKARQAFESAVGANTALAKALRLIH